MTALRHLAIWSGLVAGCTLQYVVPDGDDDDVVEPQCDGGECMEPEPCALDACGDQCVDLQSDPASCGVCDRPCDSSDECIDGECVGTCTETCDNDVEICTDGSCECRAGLMRCDDECVDITSDDDHCGMCGRDCGDMLCSAGECAATCDASLDLCDEACVDFATDPLNCGVCERECHPSQDCVAGECKSAS